MNDMRSNNHTLAIDEDNRAGGQQGFTLLLAALIASIVLSIGVAVYTIAQHEVTLSSLGRDSQFAFYAADTAAECALFWDYRYNYFAQITPAGVNPTCDQQPVSFAVTDVNGNTLNQPYSYPYEYSSTNNINLFQDTATTTGGYCVQVSVEKCNYPFKTDGSNGCDTSQPPSIHARIIADGYNVSCANIGSAPNAVQRTVELDY